MFCDRSTLPVPPLCSLRVALTGCFARCTLPASPAWSPVERSNSVSVHIRRAGLPLDPRCGFCRGSSHAKHGRLGRWPALPTAPMGTPATKTLCANFSRTPSARLLPTPTIVLPHHHLRPSPCIAPAHGDSCPQGSRMTTPRSPRLTPSTALPSPPCHRSASSLFTSPAGRFLPFPRCLRARPSHPADNAQTCNQACHAQWHAAPVPYSGWASDSRT